MRRRFGSRRRRGSSTGTKGPIDLEKWFERIADDGSIPVGPLEAVEVPDLPNTFAVVGRESAGQGEFNHVAFSPHSGGDALLAALVAGFSATGSRDFSGAVLALAPQWNSAARRRLSLVSPSLPFRVRALEASSLQDVGTLVQGETSVRFGIAEVGQLAAASSSPADRDLFMRAARAFEGLAAKHGGVARGAEGGLQLIVHARKLAELRVDEDGVALEIWIPQRSLARLSADDLPDALDRLEVQVRKRQNDRRIRKDEEGLRTRLMPLVAEARELRSYRAWPLPGDDPEVLDFLGVDAKGQPVVGLYRSRWDVDEWGPVLDGILALRGALPQYLAGQGEGLRYGMPQLVLASKETTDAARKIARGLSLEIDFFGVRSHWSRGFEVSRLSTSEETQQREPQRTPQPRAEKSRDSEVQADEGSEPDRPEQGHRNRSRRRRRGGRGRRAPSVGENSTPREETSKDDPVAEPSPARFEEVSFFDLEEEPREGPSGRSGRRGRGGRGRRSGGRGDRSSEGREDSDDRRPERAGSAAGDESPQTVSEDGLTEAEDVDGDLAFDADAGIDEMLSPLPDDVPDFEGESFPTYPQDEAQDEEESSESVAESPEAPARPRQRAAILVLADRATLLSAVVLARDIRMVEGIWVYPQEEIMTFFRSVATDLREETPIYILGFTPSPAREILQAATLYGNRLIWLDYHEWPPEDREALAQVLGESNIDVRPGTGTCLPAVLEGAVRRSRFSDKLVDLAAGRFSQHDYEKWGRVWWWRLGEFASRPGDRRADLEPLLAGRPSDLAKEVATVAVPAPPAEVAYVAGRDFRLIHFASHSLVVVDTPVELDPHLAGRIARERYGASLSLAMNENFETLTLTGEELPGRRSLDVLALVEHLGNKLPWLEVLSGEDRVARFRIDDLARQPHRLDEVIGRIASGRSILER